MPQSFGCMLFRGMERNQCGIFCKMLKCGMIIPTTAIDIASGRFVESARGL